MRDRHVCVHEHFETKNYIETHYENRTPLVLTLGYDKELQTGSAVLRVMCFNIVPGIRGVYLGVKPVRLLSWQQHHRQQCFSYPTGPTYSRIVAFAKTRTAPGSVFIYYLTKHCLSIVVEVHGVEPRLFTTRDRIYSPVMHTP